MSLPGGCHFWIFTSVRICPVASSILQFSKPTGIKFTNCSEIVAFFWIISSTFVGSYRMFFVGFYRMSLWGRIECFLWGFIECLCGVVSNVFVGSYRMFFVGFYRMSLWGRIECFLWGFIECLCGVVSNVFCGVLSNVFVGSYRMFFVGFYRMFFVGFYRMFLWGRIECFLWGFIECFCGVVSNVFVSITWPRFLLVFTFKMCWLIYNWSFVPLVTLRYPFCSSGNNPRFSSRKKYSLFICASRIFHMTDKHVIGL